jgi:hypothetical protein
MRFETLGSNVIRFPVEVGAKSSIPYRGRAGFAGG